MEYNLLDSTKNRKAQAHSFGPYAVYVVSLRDRNKESCHTIMNSIVRRCRRAHDYNIIYAVMYNNIYTAVEATTRPQYLYGTQYTRQYYCDPGATWH